MEKNRRKLHTRFYSLAAVSFLLLFSTSNSALAVDSADGPEPDVSRICVAAWVLCQTSCNGAKYTEDKRAGCLTECDNSLVSCDPAKRGGAQGNVGDVGTGGVLQDETIKKKKRKTGIKQ